MTENSEEIRTVKGKRKINFRKITTFVFISGLGKSWTLGIWKSEVGF